MSPKPNFLFLLFFLLPFIACEDILPGKKPEADFTIETGVCTNGPCEVQFINRSKNSEEFRWDFGDGETSSEKDPVHTYDTIGVYEVTLEAISNDGAPSKSKTLRLGEQANGETALIDNDKDFWLYGGGSSYPLSFRNHHYEIEVNGNVSDVEITLESENIDVYLWLYNSLGQRVTRSSGGRIATIKKSLDNGKYRVITGTRERGKIGNYTLDISGATSPVRIKSETLKPTNETIWKMKGGGYQYPLSYRNDLYSFEVTQNNSTVDIVLESPDAEVALHLFSDIAKIDSEYRGKSEFIIEELDAGIYYLSAGTYSRNLPESSYRLNIEGQVQNLNYNPGKLVLFNDEWKTNGGGYSNPNSFRNHIYAVNISENNTTLDIILTSTQADVVLWLYPPDRGNYLKRQSGDRTEFIVNEVNKGIYYVHVGTYSRREPEASYELNIVGKISEVKKIPSQTEIVNDVWTNGGGYRKPDSPFNTIYTVDVTENNSVLDIELESNDVDVVFWVYDPNGVQLTSQRGDRYEFKVLSVNRGTYKIICSPYTEGANGNYTLSIVGQLNNFKKIN